MSETLDQLRSKRVAPTVRNKPCVCGDPVEVIFYVQIRERGAKQESLRTGSLRLCASCAVARMDEALS